MICARGILVLLCVECAWCAKRSIFTDNAENGLLEEFNFSANTPTTVPEGTIDLFHGFKEIPIEIDGEPHVFNVTIQDFAMRHSLVETFCRRISSIEFVRCTNALKQRIFNALYLLYIDHTTHLSNYLTSQGFDLRYSEGGSLFFMELLKVKMNLAMSKNTAVICECGFNLGHSSLLWLVANPQARVVSFDLGEHAYVYPVARYLHAHFPRRFSLVLGNSLETLPKYADQHAEIFGKTDLFFVDGGHEATVAQSDLFWAIAYLNKDNTHATIVMDDVQMSVVRTAWDRMIASGLLIEAGMVTDSASACVETDPFLSVVSTVRDRLSCKRMQGYVLPNADPVLTEMKDVVIGLARLKR